MAGGPRPWLLAEDLYRYAMRIVQLSDFDILRMAYADSPKLWKIVILTGANSRTFPLRNSQAGHDVTGFGFP
jgi:hypothetical protein